MKYGDVLGVVGKPSAIRFNRVYFKNFRAKL
jgi:hypothetical protein